MHTHDAAVRWAVAFRQQTGLAGHRTIFWIGMRLARMAAPWGKSIEGLDPMQARLNQIDRDRRGGVNARLSLARFLARRSSSRARRRRHSTTHACHAGCLFRFRPTHSQPTVSHSTASALHPTPSTGRGAWVVRSALDGKQAKKSRSKAAGLIRSFHQQTLGERGEDRDASPNDDDHRGSSSAASSVIFIAQAPSCTAPRPCCLCAGRWRGGPQPQQPPQRRRRVPRQ